MISRGCLVLLAAAVIHLTAGTGLAGPVFISEYGEGSSNNKYIEIYNGSGSAIDMADYQLWVINNVTNQPGRSWGEASPIELSGAVAASNVYVVCHSRADAAIKVHADAESGSVNHNGNDAVGLAMTNSAGGGWTLIDAVGREGENPGNGGGWTVSGVEDGTANHTLVRIVGVEGTTNWLAVGSTQWVVKAADDFSQLGYHGMPPAQPPFLLKRPPETNLVVLVNREVRFTVQAGDVNGDLISLGATNLPAGAVLTANPAQRAGSVTNSFTWTPSTTGIFPFTFYAGDADGANTLEVSIEVSGVLPPPTRLWFNELHYDNDGTDADEGYEIAGKAGTSLANVWVYPYEGDNGTVESSKVLQLSGTIPNERDGFGAVWFPSSGTLENGSTSHGEGLALVRIEDGVTNVLQFLSYEEPGGFAAFQGPAAGLLASDVGVEEPGPAGTSLQLAGKGSAYSDFTWTGPVQHSRGLLNAGQTMVPNPTVLIVR